jgi:hypothetical protein
MHGDNAFVFGIAALIFGIFVFTSPLWLLVSFLAFAIGRKQFDLKFLFALITGEAVCVASSVAIFSLLRAGPEVPRSDFIVPALIALLFSLPLWFPIVGLSYAGGRKSYKPAYLVVLVAIELLIIVLSCVILRLVG